ncbi:hypothetical protein [Peptoniphilus raoultii]|uniref:hypothetical protein n=1 Tax=Peptoniphilus raoultii TaxID=1776387 RepID=UPI0014300F6E|nr:hypothetical protein [Peptoniphilus raoultii]
MNPFLISYDGFLALVFAFITIIVTYKSLKGHDGHRLIFIFITFVILILYLLRGGIM